MKLVIDKAWQTVLHGLYGPESEVRSPEGKGLHDNPYST